MQKFSVLLRPKQTNCVMLRARCERPRMLV